MDIKSFTRRPDTPVLSESSRLDEQYQVFPAEVVRVDYERKVVAIRDKRHNQIYQDVVAFPANSSSVEGTDIDMPEEGTACLAATLEWNKGYSQHIIICYLLSATTTSQDAVSQRSLSGASKPLGEWTDRTRGVYRKAYPGQHTIAKTDGYTAKFANGWDQAAMDLSRDQLDPFRRTRTSSTGRQIIRTDTALKYEGFVHRPQANSSDITPHILPDGSKEWVLYLNPTVTDWSARYFGQNDLLIQDMIPFVEHVEKIQEFGLDYPVPHEIYETDMWDKILGTVQPFPDPSSPTDSQNWWNRTAMIDESEGASSNENMYVEDQAWPFAQPWDHPNNPAEKHGVGPALKDGPTPRRRGWIIEKAEGTLVGSNMFDATTYGKVLKPMVFPLTTAGRFAADTMSGYSAVTKLPDQSEARLAASAWSLRFPYEYNTTRFEVTKEGMALFEIGSTLPKENIVWDSGKYEHPHGAGRSLEGNFTGSVKLVLGKNRDEEESLDIQTTGGAVLRLGADDASIPNFRRVSQTQIRGKKDMITDRSLQYWGTQSKNQLGHWASGVKLTPGDAGNLSAKTGAENVSLRAALDGGLVLRLGGRNKGSKRRHFFNGYQDGPGKTPYSITDSNRLDSRSPNRPVYQLASTATRGAALDTIYQFHDLTKVGQPLLGNAPPIGISPYDSWAGDATGGFVDYLGSSADIHAVRDLFVRAGKNDNVGLSATFDLAGAILAAIGADSMGRSLIAQLDGAIEATIGSNQTSSASNYTKAIRLEINGDVDIVIKGNLHLNVTGDIISETNHRLALTHTADIRRATAILDVGNSINYRESGTGGIQQYEGGADVINQTDDSLPSTNPSSPSFLSPTGGN